MCASFKTFWIEPSGRVRRYLRVFTFADDHKCAGKDGYHNAMVHLDDVAVEYANVEKKILRSYSADDFTDRAWPTCCSGCGLAFTDIPKIQRQIFTDQIYRAADGQEFALRDVPPGAMWHQTWLEDVPEYAGVDGIALAVQLPNGHQWMVDSQASNCTRNQRQPVEGKPGCTRFVRSHYCWCRHGDPRTGRIHVDKSGDTCAAGAGSILSGNWHGFLHDGLLLEC